eukprot:bmy_10831T0
MTVTGATRAQPSVGPRTRCGARTHGTRSQNSDFGNHVTRSETEQERARKHMGLGMRPSELVTSCVSNNSTSTWKGLEIQTLALPHIINAVVLLILLSALADPDQYHFSSSELGGDFEFMDDASLEQRVHSKSRTCTEFGNRQNMCIAIAISLLMILICAMATYGAYKQHAAWIIPFFCYQIFDFALNTLVAVTGYLISCVWNCYRYINGRNSSDVLVYVTSNDTTDIKI